MAQDAVCCLSVVFAAHLTNRARINKKSIKNSFKKKSVKQLVARCRAGKRSHQTSSPKYFDGLHFAAIARDTAHVRGQNLPSLRTSGWPARKTTRLAGF